ncbi:MAG: nicotinate-nucleotide adenylyltransferase, partial [Rhodothermales bacterium]
HIQLVCELRKLGLIEQAIFMPAGIPPHKRERQICSGEHRMAMLTLALEKMPYARASDFELTREGVSYTILTARHYARRFGEKLRLLIGADSLCELHTWKQARELVAEFAFVVYRRPGYVLPSAEVLRDRFGDPGPSLLAAVVDAPEFAISSTELRLALKEEKDCGGLLPPAVHRYIHRHRLYTG